MACVLTSTLKSLFMKCIYRDDNASFFPPFCNFRYVSFGVCVCALFRLRISQHMIGFNEWLEGWT